MATLVDRDHRGEVTEEAQAIAAYFSEPPVPTTRAGIRQALENIVKQFRTADVHLTLRPETKGWCKIEIRERPRMMLVQEYELSVLTTTVGEVHVPDETAQAWLLIIDKD